MSQSYHISDDDYRIQETTTRKVKGVVTNKPGQAHNDSFDNSEDITWVKEQVQHNDIPWSTEEVGVHSNEPSTSIQVEPNEELQHAAVEASHSAGGGAALRDVVLGMSDGLTVPFALAAGMAGAFSSSKVIVLAVLAELTAGGISMGLGGYMSGRTEVLQYSAERKREEWEVVNCPEIEKEEIYDILKEYGLTRSHVRSILDHFEKNPSKWVDFMMKFELGLEKPDQSRPWKSALFVGLSYVFGGFIPLVPYFFIESSLSALKVSVMFTLIALFIFGLAKGHVVSHGRLSSAVETTVVGAVAAASAFVIARWFNSLTNATGNS